MAALRGKTLVNLNYTASLPALQSAVNKAQIRSIYTSSRFVRKLEQKGYGSERTSGGRTGLHSKS